MRYRAVIMRLAIIVAMIKKQAGGILLSVLAKRLIPRVFLWYVLTTLAAATARRVQPVPTPKPASPMVLIFP